VQSSVQPEAGNPVNLCRL